MKGTLGVRQLDLKLPSGSVGSKASGVGSHGSPRHSRCLAVSCALAQGFNPALHEYSDAGSMKLLLAQSELHVVFHTVPCDRFNAKLALVAMASLCLLQQRGRKLVQDVSSGHVVAAEWPGTVETNENFIPKMDVQVWQPMRAMGEVTT